MQLKTILNRCHKFKSFVYDQVRFVGEAIEVTVLPRANAKAICSHCSEPAPVYDHLAERRFEFIPIWGYRVFFLYLMRLQYVCSDMWKPYLKVIKKKAGHALPILDRFHIVAKLNKAIDEVRAGVNIGSCRRMVTNLC